MHIDAVQYDLHSIVRESPWFADLPQDALTMLLQSATIKTYTAREYLYRPGEKTSVIYCLLSGRLRISMNSHLGHQFALTDLEANYWLGEASLIADQARIQEAQLQTDADVLSIPRGAMLEVAERYPLLYRNLFYENLRRSRQIYELMAAMVFYPLRARLAGRQLDLMTDYGISRDGGVLLDVQLTQNDFARLCLGSRQRVNKIFREWTEQGVLRMHRDKYILLDLRALEHEVSAGDN